MTTTRRPRASAIRPASGRHSTAVIANAPTTIPTATSPAPTGPLTNFGSTGTVAPSPRNTGRQAANTPRNAARGGAGVAVRPPAQRQPAGVPARRPTPAEPPAPAEPVADLAPDALPDAPDSVRDAPPDPIEHASGDVEIAEAAERAIAELDGPTTPLQEDEYPQA